MTIWLVETRLRRNEWVPIGAWWTTKAEAQRALAKWNADFRDEEHRIIGYERKRTTPQHRSAPLEKS